MTGYRVIFDITKTHLLTRLKQSSIAALGVTFGIGTFITLVSFMTGLNNLLDGLILNRTPHIHVYNEIKPSAKQPVDLFQAYSDAFRATRSIKPKQNLDRLHNAIPMLELIRQDERVKGATPQVGAQVFYQSGSSELNGMVNGISPMQETHLFNFGDYVVQGDVKDLVKNNNGILLGAGIASSMSLEIGDRVQVSSVKGAPIPLKVVGIYQTGLTEVDNAQSYVNLSTAQQLLGQGNDYITDIHVKLWDLEKAAAMTEEIVERFSVSAIDIKSANAQFETGTDVRNLITYAVSITLLIVAGFGIYNILNMLIYEKMNDIAILKATGFSGSDIRMVFISQAMIIGLIGGTLGLIIGWIISVLISHTPFDTPALPTIETYPVNLDPDFFLIGIVFALVSTFLAGFLPARRAQNMDPVDIIRGQ